MRISDWSSDVCSSDLRPTTATRTARLAAALVFVLAASVLPAAAASVRLMAFGDSLTHGYGLPPGETFPEQLEAALRADGLDVVVLNAGNSGDTTAGGLARLDWALADDPDAVILERSEEHTSELQSLMRTSYAVFCLTKKTHKTD